MQTTKFSVLTYSFLLTVTGCSLTTQDSDWVETWEQAAVVSSAACEVEYLIGSEWSGGFGANVRVTNKGAAVSTWTLSWRFDDGQRITSLWNGTHSQSGSDVSVRDAGWNGVLANGSSVAVGFNGTWSGQNTLPSDFRLNGVSCQDEGGPGPSVGGTSAGGTSAGGSTGGSGSIDDDPSPGGGQCDAPAWNTNAYYQSGDIVAYQGSLYIAEHENPGYDPTISTWFWDPYDGDCDADSGSGGNTSSGGASTGGSSSTSDAPFSEIVSEALFNQLFPRRSSFYTYDGLLEAAAIYPAFAGTGSMDVRKREAAAFLANVTHETGDLVYVEEINRGEYCDSSPWFCPCEPGKRYYGRGPIQLSWNYNYCSASLDIFGDREVLRRNPERVAQEPWLAWATALWFWMTQTGAGSMTAHSAMVNGIGFGETIRTINGGLECNGANPGTVNLRIGYYQEITGLLSVHPGSNLGC